MLQPCAPQMIKRDDAPPCNTNINVIPETDSEHSSVDMIDYSERPIATQNNNEKNYGLPSFYLSQNMLNAYHTIIPKLITLVIAIKRVRDGQILEVNESVPDYLRLNSSKHQEVFAFT